MYMTLRTVRAVAGRGGDAVALANQVTRLVNDRHGASFAVAVQVGGDPDVIGASAPWESLGAYQAARDAYMADDEIVALLEEAGSLFVSTQDQIARILALPGERKLLTALGMARMHLPRMAEAIPLALEVCEFVEARVGVTVGLATAFTGNQAEVAFIARYDSLDEMASVTETLHADPDYLDFFKRGGDLYVDGSFEQTIWQRVSD